MNSPNNPPNPPCNTDLTDVERAIERLSKDLEREHGGNCNICLDETIVQRSDLRAAIAALLVSNRSGVEEIEQVISAWAFAHDIDGATRNDLFKRLRSALDTEKEK